MSFLEYIKGLQGVLERIANEQGENIIAAGAVVANTLEGGGIVHTFGTGHSHIIAEDVFFRAGGIAAVNPILDERFLFLKGALESTRSERRSGIAGKLIENEKIGPADAAIIISNSGRNAVPVEMALEVKARGLPVIAITSTEQSRASAPRHSSGKRLFEIADVVIDNCVPPGDALVRIEGIDSMTGASSTVAGSAIIHSIIVEALSELARRGISPAVLPSANMENTSADSLKDILRPYEGRIRYLDLDTEID
jgi:uncharacterized phosphosugar-binding protein